MTTFTDQKLDITQQEYVIAEGADTGDDAKSDDVDWRAWWAEYAETWE
jgi:hypothetical protein